MTEQNSETALKHDREEEMKRCLAEQRKRYPRMNEEDVVKFVFQGMLGVGHLIASRESALLRLREETDALGESLPASAEEPLVEKISADWVRINLRPAKAQGITPEDLALRLYRSAQMRPLPFTRQDVYDFCVKLDGSERMRTAAIRVLDEAWLPSHSAQYRAAYHPAYRVLHEDFGRV